MVGAGGRPPERRVVSEGEMHRTHGTTDALIPTVAVCVRANITASCDAPAFRDLLIALLERPGRVLSSTDAPKWPAFVLDTCHALGGDAAAAVHVAAAVELVVAAIDVRDDAIDGDLDDAGSEARDRAINASLALNAVGLRCLLTGNGVPIHRLPRVLEIVSHGTVACCDGQDADLLLEASHDVTEEDAHDMTRRKSGSLVAMACQAGAAVATESSEILDLVARYGTYVGITAQLLNDIAGVEPDRTGRGTDLTRRKKTLPVAYALQRARESREHSIIDWYTMDTRVGRQGEERLANRFRELGAMHFTWVVADWHRREAWAVIDELSRKTGLPGVRSLRRLVPDTHARRVPQLAA
jgi:geranylgeranyl pyrophosphate synthase